MIANSDIGPVVLFIYQAACAFRRLNAADNRGLAEGEIEKTRASYGSQSRDPPAAARSCNLRTAGTDSADASLSERNGRTTARKMIKANRTVLVIGNSPIGAARL